MIFSPRESGNLSAKEMHEIRTQIDIEASAEDVWAVLTDFPEYPAWNPFIRAITGRVEPGAKIEVHVVPASGPAMNVAATILVADPPRELRWHSHLLSATLLAGEHHFVIELIARERVCFRHGEHFRGILIPLLRRWLDGGVRTSYERMNAALKQRAEDRAHAARLARAAAPDSKNCTITRVTGVDDRGQPLFGERTEEPCTVVKLPGDGSDVSARIGSAPEYPAAPGGEADAVLMLTHTTRAAVGDMIEVAGWKLKVTGMSPGFDSIGKRVWTVVETSRWE